MTPLDNIILAKTLASQISPNCSVDDWSDFSKFHLLFFLPVKGRFNNFKPTTKFSLRKYTWIIQKILKGYNYERYSPRRIYDKEGFFQGYDRNYISINLQL
jgi:hypothetical protein